MFHGSLGFFSPPWQALAIISHSVLYRGSSPTLQGAISMGKVSLTVVLGALLAATPLQAKGEDSAAKKPIGVWTKSSGDQKITFQFKADKMIVTLNTGDQTIKVDADYGVTKDGRVFGIITNVTKPGNDGPNEGDLFSFKFTAVDKKMTIEDLKGTRENAERQQLVQGDDEKKENSAYLR